MEKEDVHVLMQLINAEEEAVRKLEDSFSRRDIEKFNRAKMGLIEFCKQISKVVDKK